MGEHEATKLVITLHTHSEKLQSSVIQKDMDLAKLVSTDQSLELKNNILHSDTYTIGTDTIFDN